jgi:hypothetical protein
MQRSRMLELLGLGVTVTCMPTQSFVPRSGACIIACSRIACSRHLHKNWHERTPERRRGFTAIDASLRPAQHQTSKNHTDQHEQQADTRQRVGIDHTKVKEMKMNKHHRKLRYLGRSQLSTAKSQVLEMPCYDERRSAFMPRRACWCDCHAVQRARAQA